MTIGPFASNWHSRTFELSKDFSLLNATCVQLHFVFSSTNCLVAHKCHVTPAETRSNSSPFQGTISMLGHLDSGMSFTARKFSERRQSESKLKPRYWTNHMDNLNFPRQSRNPHALMRWLSSGKAPTTIMSLKYAAAPYIPEVTASITCWKISGAAFTPNGRRL